VLGETLRRSHNDIYQKEMMLETVLGATPIAILRAGQVRDVGGEPPMLPFYGTLTVATRW
jgi:hypothetical protein